MNSNGIEVSFNNTAEADVVMEDAESDLLCPVCLELIDEATIIPCGHTFCNKCLKLSMENSKRCPVCGTFLLDIRKMTPNLLINSQVYRYKKKMKMSEALSGQYTNVIPALRSYLKENAPYVKLEELTEIISTLRNKKEEITLNSEVQEYSILCSFFERLKTEKEEEMLSVQTQISFIEEDLRVVKDRLHKVTPTSTDSELASREHNLTEKINSGLDLDTLMRNSACKDKDEMHVDIDVPLGTKCLTNEERDESLQYKKVKVENINLDKGEPQRSSDYFSRDELLISIPSLSTRKKRLNFFFEELKDSYPTRQTLDNEETSSTKLDDFGTCVVKVSRFSRLRLLASIDFSKALNRPTHQKFEPSSIEFDKDEDVFAVGSRTKKVYIFDYEEMIRNVSGCHYPCSTMDFNSPVYSVSWNQYYKNQVASCEGNGEVTIWDSFLSKKMHVYRDHETTCRSLDFHKMDTKLLVSGSDDRTVKMWHMDQERPLFSLDTDEPVNCVKFNPENRYHVAFSCNDGFIRYHDLRNMNDCLQIYCGHRKEVSLIDFISGDEIVSEAYDSVIKVWNVNENNCIRTLSGHVNTKKVVGLATDGEYLVCGSENNSIYVYYKQLTKNLFSYPFDGSDDPGTHVSAVCMKKSSNVVVAGNNRGTLKVLQMV